MSALSRLPEPAAMPLDSLRADVWRAASLAAAPAQTVPTGDALLDAQLPGGGWPRGALTELLQDPGVHNEWRLLLPALAHCGSGPVALVAAPHRPFAPALQAQGLAAQRLVGVGGPRQKRPFMQATTVRGPPSSTPTSPP